MVTEDRKFGSSKVPLMHTYTALVALHLRHLAAKPLVYKI